MISKKVYKTFNYIGSKLKLLEFTNKSTSSNIYFYADSSGELRTNLYDDLRVRRLVPITEPSNYNYQTGQEYVIQTDSSNLVHNINAVKLNEDADAGKDDKNEKGNKARYLISGKPDITLKFPWTEIIIVVLVIAVIARLLIKKDEKGFY